jgi:hypothetical protein
MVRLTFPPPVDFAALLMDLRRTGMSGRDICAKAGLTRGAVGEYQVGRCQPTHGRSERLVALWCARMGRTRAEVPQLATATLSAAKVAREDRGPADKFAVADSAHAARDLFAITLVWGSRSAAA